MVFRIAIIGLLLVVSVGMTIAAEVGVPEALTRKLAEFPGVERGKVIPVTDDVIAHVFPGSAFYVLRFLQYPLARVPPAQLSASNLFVLKPGGSVDVLRDAAGLETFFRGMLAPTRTEGEARDVVVAWLRLTQEFRQDGFFQFSISPGAVQVTAPGASAVQATGKAVVDPRGGNATLRTTRSASRSLVAWQMGRMPRLRLAVSDTLASLPAMSNVRTASISPLGTGPSGDEAGRRRLSCRAARQGRSKTSASD